MCPTGLTSGADIEYDPENFPEHHGPMSMSCTSNLLLTFLAASALCAQTVPTVAVRAGRLFDPRAGRMLANQVILIQGDRITAVGAGQCVSIPAGASVFDLSRATVLPGLIDGHLHLTDVAG